VLIPYAQDALASVSGPFELVAAARRSLHSPAPTGLVDLGNPHSPSFEALASARAGLVVGDRMLHAAQAEKLAASGAEVMLLDSSSVDATFAGLEELGKRVGAGEAMAAQTADARKRLAALALGSPLETLALFGAPGSFMVLTDRTWQGDLLGQLGFSDVAGTVQGDERFPGMVALGDEQLARLRPELVLLVAHGDPAAIEAAFEKRIAEGGPWRGVGAAATRGVHVLDARLFAANPGLALPRAAEALVALAAPPSVSAPAGP
jgi:iron complex transport system substrate-binding protein